MNITKKQIQLIHIAKQQLNIDDDIYMDILSNYNVSSSKDLSYNQAEALLRHLRSKGFKVIKKRHKVKLNNKTVKLASIAQFKLIDVLKANIVWKVSYEAWLENRMGLKKVLTSKEASKVIEGMKGMLNINTNYTEFLRLPFPNNYNIENVADKWYFDCVDNKLIHICEGEICQIIQ